MIRQFQQTAQVALQRYEQYLKPLTADDARDLDSARHELAAQKIALAQSFAAWTILAADSGLGAAYGPESVRLSTLAAVARQFEDSMSLLNSRYRLWRNGAQVCQDDCCAHLSAVERPTVEVPAETQPAGTVTAIPDDGNPIIWRAVGAMRTFGAYEGDPAVAVAMLDTWTYAPQLTTRERVTVLAHYTGNAWAAYGICPRCGAKFAEPCELRHDGQLVSVERVAHPGRPLATSRIGQLHLTDGQR